MFLTKWEGIARLCEIRWHTLGSGLVPTPDSYVTLPETPIRAFVRTREKGTSEIYITREEV